MFALKQFKLSSFLFILIGLLLAAVHSHGQTMAGSTGTAAAFNTYPQVMSSATATQYVNLQYSFSTGKTFPDWSLKVRASGDFSNGTSTVPLQYISLKFNRVTSGGPASIGAPPTAVPLSTTETTLINMSPAALGNPNYTTTHAYDMIIQGGNHLLLTPGVYTTTLMFT